MFKTKVGSDYKQSNLQPRTVNRRKAKSAYIIVIKKESRINKNKDKHTAYVVQI